MSHFQAQSQQMQTPHQQQPMVVNAAYQKPKKQQQNGSDVRLAGSQQYSSGNGGLGMTSTQNGNHQPLVGKCFTFFF